MKYDTIGIGYDRTRRPDPRIAERILALLEPQAKGHYLDVACGTGNYTKSLYDLGLDMVGIDQSKTMLDAARAKYPTIKWQQADVTKLPFPDASFDGIICTQAIHHFSDLEAAVCEIARVLRGGRLVIFRATRHQMRSYWLNAYFPEALGRAIDQQPSDHMLLSAFDRAQLHVVTMEPWLVPTDPIDLFLYSGKHNPSLYLNARVRQGISTFANLADADEVDRGLQRLTNDIATGEIAHVMAGYVSGGGDYQFVVAQPVRK
jgi:SAM-dependent methyltransferase